jgi:hypothetical protein
LETVEYINIIIFSARQWLTLDRMIAPYPKLKMLPLFVALRGATTSNGHSGKFVTSFIFFVSAVSGDPDPLHVMGFAQIKDHFPEISVQHGLFLRIHPVLSNPTLYPLGHALDHVFGIGDHSHLAGSFEKTKAFDHSGQLHPVVRGVRRKA